MNDDQLLRYNRQMMLPQIDFEGQDILLSSRVLIIGLGGLGSPVAMYLAAAGVGTLVLADFDRVDLPNLQRQIVHKTSDVGRRKVESARDTLLAINPDVEIITIDHKMDEAELNEQLKAADVVVDASDNFPTRFALNDACVRTKVPLVSGAAIRFEGQVSVFHNERNDSPCYRCLYKDEDEETGSCSENGVLAPVVGIIGSIQATEALKVLLNLGDTLSGRLLILDAMTMEWRSMRLRKDPECPVCSSS
ncbi:MAG: molybdopterin-synthase adenylyltransferase MoeB [Gammaproteobacteria bacterium]|nr:molybdopterin-synthase adenylyltransferase MoeB [Gammaproteobacteria bacterium]